LKPWLLNILACPIDKHHPLDAYFFTLETPEADMQRMALEAGKPDESLSQKYRQLAKQILDDTISPSSIKTIKDKTGSDHSAILKEKAIKALEKAGKSKDLDQKGLLEKLPGEVDALYRYLNMVEVREGVLVCSECGRWYPIGNNVETIPELMPDDLREREKELDWMRKWESKIPGETLRKGKPFHL
jgi:uncharacterized protein YbaR (Trm112 family)